MNAPSNACPNCGGVEFYAGDAARTLPIQVFARAPKFHLRICGTCGKVDWFLTGKDLEKVKKQFPREQA